MTSLSLLKLAGEYDEVVMHGDVQYGVVRQVVVLTLIGCAEIDGEVEMLFEPSYTPRVLFFSVY